MAPDPAAAAEAVVAARQRMTETIARTSGLPPMPEDGLAETGAVTHCNFSVSVLVTHCLISNMLA